MAFILQQNGYPAGLRELTYDDAGFRVNGPPDFV
jgi:hypothetical protein